VFKKGLVPMNNLQEWLKEVVVNRQHIDASPDSITITMRGKPNPHHNPANDQAILNLVNDGLGLPHRTLRASNLSLVLPTLLLICVSAFSSGCLLQAQQKRTYHKAKIAELATDNPAHWKYVHTHIEVEGYVTYITQEDDGDWHIRLCDDAKIKTMDVHHCVVVEVIPELKPNGKVFIRPHLGDHLRVRGISRYDAELPGHNWWEVHPVEEIEVAH
jgi:hypothetical protein